METKEQLFNELFKANDRVDELRKKWKEYTDPCIGNLAEIQRFDIADKEMHRVWEKYQEALAEQAVAWERIRKDT
jgi:hypothetical protein